MDYKTFLMQFKNFEEIFSYSQGHPVKVHWLEKMVWKKNFRYQNLQQPLKERAEKLIQATQKNI